MPLTPKIPRAVLAFFGYAALLLYLSLYPFTWRNDPWQFSLASLTWIFPATRGDWTDVILNVIGYIPLGIFARAAFASSFLAGLLSFTLAFGIEWLQSGLQMRDASWRDVACNTIGGMLGTLAYHYCRQSRLLQQRFAIHPRMIFFGVCWITWINYPFIPILRIGQIRQALQGFWTLPPFDRTVEIFFGALIVFAVARASAASPLFYALLWACLPLRILIHNLSLSATLLAAATVAAAFSYKLFAPPLQRRHALWVGLALFLFVVYSQLSPFQFQTPASKFNWLPFGIFIDGFERGVLSTVGRKILLYGGCIWALQEGGIPLRRASLLVATLLLGTELIQPYLPGRTPETTDPLLALAAGAFFAVYSRPRNLLQ